MMEQVAGVVLAGGLSRRMGGGDKGLRELGGKPLMAHTIERLSAQASPVAINANGDLSRFAVFGLPVIPDLTADHPGPLAGVLAGMRWAETAAPHARFIATAACDTPFFPEDMAERFLAAAGRADSAIALASSAGRTHPVFALWSLSLADDLQDALASGARKVSDWIDRHQHFIVEFPPVNLSGALADPFFNVNTPDDLAQAATFLAARETSGKI
jgi:molybdopterin-guanine dinucleotide biosynthesis protein A